MHYRCKGIESSTDSATWRIKNEFALKKGEKSSNRYQFLLECICMKNGKMNNWTFNHRFVLPHHSSLASSHEFHVYTCIANLIAQIECVQERKNRYIECMNVSEKICLWNSSRCCWSKVIICAHIGSSQEMGKRERKGHENWMCGGASRWSCIVIANSTAVLI